MIVHYFLKHVNCIVVSSIGGGWMCFGMFSFLCSFFAYSPRETLLFDNSVLDLHDFQYRNDMVCIVFATICSLLLICFGIGLGSMLAPFSHTFYICL